MDIKATVWPNNINMQIQLGKWVLNILYINYQPPYNAWNAQNHCHPNFELHFVTCGKLLLKTLENNFDLEGGTFYLTRPGIFHEEYADKDNPPGMFCISFEIIHNNKVWDDYLTKETNEIIDTLLSSGNWIGNDIFDSSEIIYKLINELNDRYLGYHLTAKSLVIAIIVNCARSLVSKLERSSTELNPNLSNMKAIIIEAFFNRSREKITLNMLAKEVGVSTKQLNRILIEYYSMTFEKKLVNRRLLDAKKLLVEEGLNIEEVAEMAGFSSTSYFSKVFKENIGIAPSEYKNKEKLKLK